MGIFKKGWKAYKNMLDSRKFKKILKRETAVGVLKAADYLRSEYQRTMESGQIQPKNKALTVAIKGRNQPLVDSGRLAKAFIVRKIKWNKAVVEIPKGSPEYELGQLVTRGAIIEVSDKMRAMFHVLWQVSEGRLPSASLRGRAAELWARNPNEWYPLSPNTRAIRIPPRPFIQQVRNRSDVKLGVQSILNQSAIRAWREHVRINRGKK
jgi:hypothetical protein